MSRCCCTCCTNCKQRNCKTVIEELHKIIKEAEEMFLDANELQDEALCSVKSAMKSLIHSLELDKKIVYLSEKAEELIEDNMDCFHCNLDSEHCNKLREKVEEAFVLQAEEVIASINLLKEVAHRLTNAKCYDEKVEKYYKELVECVHAKNTCHCR